MSDVDSWSSPTEVIEMLARQNYIADRSLAMSTYLSARLGKPLLLEGEPGCGKTELAKALAAATETELIRLQCFEGLDARSALYDWNYPKQMLTIRLHERDESPSAVEKEIFTERFLLRRPLLRALEDNGPHRPVLLIDEVDRADEEFEGLLLEVLSDFQVTIPELGTIKARRAPMVIITSNRTRDLSDALKRRCLYAFVDYPSRERETEILLKRVPNLGEHLAREIVTVVQRIRSEKDLVKRPGVAETLDWAAALLALHRDALDPEVVDDTLGCLLKDAQDVQLAHGRGLGSLVGS
ncbi:MAG: MoxR family ATPase [Thermoplasmata archaeon]|nr:MoxR family ATPase [Thermoplasmata archaeon]